MSKKWMVLLVIGAALLANIAIAAENKAEEKPGAPEIVINGASKGNIPFTHAKHQKGLTDCNACHDLYPKEPGAIVKLKGEGKLEAKQVMNKQCIKCHRDYKTEGKEAGPTSCSECHKL